MRKLKRLLTILLVAVLTVTGIPFPMQTAKAEIRSDWDSLGQIFGRGKSTIVYANDAFLAMGPTGEFYTSTDGKNWTNKGNGEGYDGNYSVVPDYYDLKFLEGKYFLIAKSNYYYCTNYCSKDGIHWSAMSFDTGIYAICAMQYVADTYYALTGYAYSSWGYVHPREGSLIKSTDGINWETVIDSELNDEFVGLYYIDDKLIAIPRYQEKQYVTIKLSDNTVSWKNKENIESQMMPCSANVSEYLNGICLVADTSGLYSSVDGQNWNMISKENVTRGIMSSDDYYAISGKSVLYINQLDQNTKDFAEVFSVESETELTNIAASDDVLLVGDNYSNYYIRSIRGNLPRIENDMGNEEEIDADTLGEDDILDANELSEDDALDIDTLGENEDLSEVESISGNSVSENGIFDELDEIDDSWAEIEAETSEAEGIEWTKLNDDLMVTDYDLSDTNLDLNGHTLQVSGSMTIQNSLLKASNGQVIIARNLTVIDRSKVNGNIEVGGNLSVQDGYLDFVHAKISVQGNYTAENQPYNYGIRMVHDDDELVVKGSFLHLAPYEMAKSGGRIIVSKDITVNDHMTTGKDLDFTLNGTSKQTLTLGDKTRFGYLNIQNTSADGLLVSGTLNMDSGINNGTTLKYEGSDVVYHIPHKLLEDENVEGDLFLSGGTMDLNGKTLHVKGDMIQGDSKLLFHGGTLIVDGDYRLQSFENEENIYVSSCGSFIMEEELDTFIIKGSVYINGSCQMLAGQMHVGGDFIHNGYVGDTSINHTIIFEAYKEIAETTHRIEVDVRYGSLGTIRLEPAANYDFANVSLQRTAQKVEFGEGVEQPKTIEPEIKKYSSKEKLIQWDLSQYPDCHFNVYQASYQYSSTNIVPWENVDSFDASKNEFTISSEDNNIYAVTATNSMGIESEVGRYQTYPYWSAPQIQFYPDYYNRSWIVSKKTDNLEFYLESYDLMADYSVWVGYRTNEEDEFIKLTEQEYKYEEGTYNTSKLHVISWDPTVVKDASKVQFRFEVYDEGGCIRTYKTNTYATAFTPPGKATGLSIENYHGAPRIRWENGGSNAYYHQLVRREKGKEDVYLERVGTTYYDDSTAQDGVEYEYFVISIDKYDNESMSDESVKITIDPDQEVPSIKWSSSSGLYSGNESLNATSLDDYGIAKVEFYIISQNGIPELFATYEGNGKGNEKEYVYCYWDTTKHSDGTYQIGVVAIDTSGKKSDMDLIDVTIDNTPPENPKDVSVSASAYKAKISFTPNEDVRYYSVEKWDDEQQSWLYEWRSYSEKSELKIIEISGLKSEQNYQYRLVSQDNAGNKNYYEFAFTTTADQDGPELSSLKPTSGTCTNNIREITLSAYLYDDGKVHKCELLYSTDEGKNYSEITTLMPTWGDTESWTASYRWYPEETFEDGQTIWIKVVGYDSYGNKSFKTGTLSFDLTPPKNPSHFDAVAYKDRVILTWDRNLDVTQYYLTRTDIKTGYSMSKTIRYYNEYVDNVEFTSGFKYTLQGSDAAGNLTDVISLYVTNQSCVQLDTVGPLEEKHGGKEITLFARFADGYYEPEKKLKISYYDIDVNKYITIAENLRPEYRSKDSVIYYNWDISSIQSGNYKVKFTLTDETNAVSEKEVSYILKTNPPEKPGVLSGHEQDGKVILDWTKSSSDDCIKYHIYRREKSEEKAKLLATCDVSKTNYTDSTGTTGKEYYYFVTALDEFENESKKSNEVLLLFTEDTTAPIVNSLTPSTNVVNKTVTLQANASDDRGLAKVRFYIQRDESKVLLGNEIQTTKSASVTWDTTKEKDGIYLIEVEAEDKVGNISERLGRFYRVDNTAPNGVAITDAIVNDSNICIIWDQPKDDDVRYFAVEMKRGNGSYVKLADSVRNLNYIAYDLAPETDYTFRVRAIDQAGNVGAYGVEKTYHTKKDSVGPSIRSINVPSFASNSVSVTAYAEDNCGIGTMRFSYALSNDGKEEFKEFDVKSAGNAKSFYASSTLNTTALPEGKVYIKVECIDSYGNKAVGAEDGVVVTTNIDHTAPAKVAGLKILNTNGYAEIAWNAVSDASGVSYHIYRSTTENGSFTKRTSIQSTSYADGNVTFGQVLYYKVVAIDAAGNIGPSSDVLQLKIDPDTVKPEVCNIYANKQIGNKIGANPYMNVVSRDNKEVDTLKVSYRKKGDSQWLNVGTYNLSGNLCTTKFVWDTTGLTEGVYELRGIAKDWVGNESNPYIKEFELKVDPPKKVNIKAEPGYDYVDLTGEFSDDVVRYEVFRREAGQSEFENIATKTVGDLKLCDEKLKVRADYEYKVAAYTEMDNKKESEVVKVTTTGIDITPPECNINEHICGLLDSNIIFDARGCFDNAGIVEYLWDFGDGTSSKKMYTAHTYDQEGDYAVSLTITDTSGNTSSVSGIATVRKEGIMKTLRILDIDGNPASGVSVIVNSDDAFPYYSDNAGMVQIMINENDTTIQIYGGGFGLFEQTISKDDTQEIYTIKLPYSADVTGKLTCKKMTAEEIRQSNIDFNAAENMAVTRFELKLNFAKKDIPVTIVYYGIEDRNGNMNFRDLNDMPVYAGKEPVASGSFSSGGSVTNYSAEVLNSGTVAILTHTSTVKCLNSMYNLELQIIGLDNGSSITDGKATVVLPEGVSLAKTMTPQQQTVLMGDINSGEEKKQSWIVHAAKSGVYELKAQFEGFDATTKQQISKTFTVNCDFKCDSMSGLHLYIRPERDAYIGEAFYIQYELKNESKHEIYAVQTTFGKQQNPIPKELTFIEVDGSTMAEVVNIPLNYLFENVSGSVNSPMITEGDTVGANVLAAGSSIYGTYKTFVPGFGDRTKEYYRLIKSLATFYDNNSNGLMVTIEPVKSHISAKRYNIILPVEDDNKTYSPGFKGDFSDEKKGKEEKPKREVGDPIDLMTGSFKVDYPLATVDGVRTLQTILNYDSTMTDELSEVGYGWYHNYESKIVKEGSHLRYYTSPYSSYLFVSDNEKNNKIYGSYDAQLGVVTVSQNQIEDENFISVTDGMEDVVIHLSNEGYEVVYPSLVKCYFDQDGRLVKHVNNVGQAVLIRYDDNQTQIIDEATGKKLVLSYEKGLLTKITDPNGQNACLTYDAKGNLTTITGKRGFKRSYGYDDMHRITTVADHDNRQYVTNTYDEKGRVLTQDDGDEATALMSLSYEDNEEDYQTTIHYTKTNGGEETIVANAQGNAISDKNAMGITTNYQYDENGRLISKMNADGSGISYERDEFGRIVKAEDKSGKTIEYQYDAKGNQTSYITSDGMSMQYEYDENNLMTHARNNGVDMNYTYNENGQPTSCTVAGKGTVQYIYENGAVSSIIYPNEKSESFKYDANGNMIERINPDGVKTTYKVDAAGNVLEEAVSLKNGKTAKTSYTYDSYGRLASKTDANENTESYQYDIHGNLVKVILADGNEIQYAYDGEGNLIQTIYPNGTTKENRVYDLAGNLTEVLDVLSANSKLAYSTSGQLSEMLFADEGKVTYDYYDNGLLKSKTDAKQNTTVYGYDSNGRITSITIGENVVCAFEYDAKGNLASITDGNGNTEKQIYNSFGELTKSVDKNGNATSYAYDAIGNMTSATDPFGNKTEFVYDGVGRVVRIIKKGTSKERDITNEYSYDEVGNLTCLTDGEGNSIKMEYDLVGNVIAVYKANGDLMEKYSYDAVYHVTSVTDALGAKKDYTYDSMGNCIKEMNNADQSVTTFAYFGGKLLNQAKDAMDGITSATYDAMGNVTSFTNPNGGVTQYNYDLNQNVTDEKIGDTYHISYEYDARNQLTKKVNSRGQETVYEYDNAGRMTKQTDEVGTIRYQYDANGNLLKTIASKTGDTSIVSENTIERTYDANNNITALIDENGDKTCYEYDEFSRITKVIYPDKKTVLYDYDKNNNLVLVTDWKNRKTEYSYNEDGNLIKTQRPDGSVETRTYDVAGNLTAILDRTKDGTVITDLKYEYDNNGNIDKITDDSARLAAEKTSSGEGILRVGLDKTATMSYDKNNRLIRYNDKTVEYDLDGNMIYGPLDGEMATFVYDCRNRLIEARKDSGEITTYQYDVENQRVGMTKQKGDSVLEETSYTIDRVSNNLSRVIKKEESLKAGKSKQTYYVYGDGLLAQEDFENGYITYHYNNVGSTTALTDEEGKIKNTFAYTPYGELINGVSGVVDYLYNGKYGVMDDGNGLYYMRARYYNIDIKRFINQDVLIGWINSSMSLNRFAYVEGNPLNFLDPFGLAELKAESDNLHRKTAIAGLFTTFVGMLHSPSGLAGGAVVSTIDALGYGTDISNAKRRGDLGGVMEGVWGITMDVGSMAASGAGSYLNYASKYTTDLGTKMYKYLVDGVNKVLDISSIKSGFEAEVDYVKDTLDLKKDKDSPSKSTGSASSSGAGMSGGSGSGEQSYIAKSSSAGTEQENRVVKKAFDASTVTREFVTQFMNQKGNSYSSVMYY